MSALKVKKLIREMIQEELRKREVYLKALIASTSVENARNVVTAICENDTLSFQRSVNIIRKEKLQLCATKTSEFGGIKVVD